MRTVRVHCWIVSGDQIDADGYVLQVEAVDDTRIDRLVIQEAQAVRETDDG